MKKDMALQLEEELPHLDTHAEENSKKHLSGTGGFTFGYLNNTSRLTSVTSTTGPSTAYTYQDSTTTGEPRLSEIKNLKNSGAALSKFDYTYDSDSRISTWTQQTDSTDPQAWAMSYDSSGRWTQANVTDAVTGNPIHNYAYNFDAAGNPTYMQQDQSAGSFQNNNLNQYVSWQGQIKETFSGTISKPGTVTIQGVQATMDSTYTHFSGAVTVPSGTTLVPVTATSANGYSATQEYQVSTPLDSYRSQAAYDANGDIQSYGYYQNSNNQVVPGSLETATWDAKGEMVKLNHTDGSYLTMTYDGAGHRVAIRQYDSTSSHNLTSTEQFVSGGIISEERNASNQVTKRIFTQGEQDISGSTATSLFYTRDHLGSIREVLDASGNIKTRYFYDPWGNRTRVLGSQDCEFGFTGFYYDALSQSYLSKTRMYEPLIGKWMNRDRGGEGEGLNLYAYCNGDPINNVDPGGNSAIALAGEFSAWDWPAIGAAALDIVADTAIAVGAAAVTPLGLGIIAVVAVAAVAIYVADSDHEAPAAQVAAPHVVAAAPAGAPEPPRGPCQDGPGASDGGGPGLSNAAEGGEGFVNLASESRTAHILDGHMPPGEAGNTLFPADWSSGQIMHNVSDIATDPALDWVPQTGNGGLYTKAGDAARFSVTGVRDGVTIKVIVEPAGEGIITAFPK